MWTAGGLSPPGVLEGASNQGGSRPGQCLIGPGAAGPFCAESHCESMRRPQGCRSCLPYLDFASPGSGSSPRSLATPRQRATRRRGQFTVALPTCTAFLLHGLRCLCSLPLFSPKHMAHASCCATVTRLHAAVRSGCQGLCAAAPSTAPNG